MALHERRVERGGAGTLDYLIFDREFVSLTRVEELVEDNARTSEFINVRLPRLPGKTILAVRRRLDTTAYFEAVTDPKDIANAAAALKKPNGLKNVGEPFFVFTVLPPRKEALLNQGYKIIRTSELRP